LQVDEDDEKSELKTLEMLEFNLIDRTFESQNKINDRRAFLGLAAIKQRKFCKV
jgi:hypothetical protein